MSVGKVLSILVGQLGFILKVGTRWRVILSKQISTFPLYSQKVVGIVEHLQHLPNDCGCALIL